MAFATSGVLLYHFATTYKNQIMVQNSDAAFFIAKGISSFMDGAYALGEELAEDDRILTMNTAIQTPVLSSTVKEIHTWNFCMYKI